MVDIIDMNLSREPSPSFGKSSSRLRGATKVEREGVSFEFDVSRANSS